MERETMICRECKQECRVETLEDAFLDSAYGTTQQFVEQYLYSECCGAEVDEDE
jgi:hypothetical protein